MEKLYTVLYSFMASELGLKGLVKEVFAIIFGFWLETNKTAAWVSLTTMQKITGGTRPAVVNAIKALESRGFIRTIRSPGKCSQYSITIPQAIIDDFEATFHILGKSANRIPVKSSNPQGLIGNTSSSKIFIPQNNNRRYNNSFNHGNQSLNVGDPSEFTGDDKI